MSLSLRTTCTAGAGIAAVALAATVAVSSAGAAPAASRTTTGAVPSAAGWLSTQFVGSAKLPVPSGDRFVSGVYGGKTYINYGENDDAIFALAASKTGAAKISAADAYLRKNVEAYTDIKGTAGFGPSDGGIAKLAVGAEVRGGDGTNFGGYNLPAALKKDECAAGSTSCTAGSAANIYSSISESLVLIAEARAGGTYAPSAAAQTYFDSLQCTSGGFTSGTTACGSGKADIDGTSYAIMALQAMHVTGPQLTHAVSWLQGQQAKAGYWKVQNVANVNSTGLATSALQGVGAGYGAARTWLRAQQIRSGKGAGALRYAGTFAATATSAMSPSVLGTAQGLLGLVNGSTLAKLTSAGSTRGVQYLAPTAQAKATEKRGKTYSVYGAGFAAGEKARVELGGKQIATTTVRPDGTYHLRHTTPSSGKSYVAYKITGLSSGLTAYRHVHLVK